MSYVHSFFLQYNNTRYVLTNIYLYNHKIFVFRHWRFQIPQFLIDVPDVRYMMPEDVIIQIGLFAGFFEFYLSGQY